ncbi:MAG: hypothetical protein GWN06_21315 [Gemmatimonadetes bacterium]|nr:hypothetical protein [Gemmatimonadota bacterium]
MRTMLSRSPRSWRAAAGPRTLRALALGSGGFSSAILRTSSAEGGASAS